MWITLWAAVVYYGENKWGTDTPLTGHIYDMRLFETEAEAQAWAEETIDSWYDGDPWNYKKYLPCLYGTVRYACVSVTSTTCGKSC